MILFYILAGLAWLSLALMFWQWLVACRFPLHRRAGDVSFTPAITLLKSVKGCDEFTEKCLRSWFAQDYAGEVQILFGVAGEDDPVCAVINKLIGEFPSRDARLVVCPQRLGANAKVSKLAQLEPLASHEVLCVSDADVRAPADFLTNAVAPLRDEQVGMVNCFYRFADPRNLAMHWEAIAVNADFWSSVLQSASFKKLDFALGAVMVTRRKQLAEIGGFRALVDCLADDYQLGNRIANRGHRIELSPVVVECWSAPMSWGHVWRHQLRWARTIRVCQPTPYFFSILANGTLWPLLLVAVFPSPRAAIAVAVCLVFRLVMAFELQSRLARKPAGLGTLWMVWVKDLLQAALWAGAFAGDHVEWRGERYRLMPDGALQRK
jgi:ceramide glucosyltransferase